MSVLRFLDRQWDRLLWSLMAVAAIYVGMIMVAIVYVTVFRYLDIPYTPYSQIFIEYGFVYVLFLGSPWLIRHRGHVYIELLTAAVPSRVRDILSRTIAFVAAVVCLIWTWYTWQLFVERWNDTMAFDELRAQYDIRLWLNTVAFPFGFLLMGIEFARYVVVRETMHTGAAGVGSDRVELEETKRSLTGEPGDR